MKAKKTPIHFNSEELESLNRLSKLMGFGDLSSVYGAIPKTIKFSITFMESWLKSGNHVIPDLKPDEIDIFFQTIKNFRKEQERLKAIETLQKEA